MYKKGDYVVYRHDVCKIKDIKKDKLISNIYYVLSPIINELSSIGLNT